MSHTHKHKHTLHTICEAEKKKGERNRLKRKWTGLDWTGGFRPKVMAASKGVLLWW